MNATSTQLMNNVNLLITTAINSFDKALGNIAWQAWRILIIFLKAHWGLVFLLILAALFFSFIIALVSGRYKLFGSLLYNFFYFGVLFILGLIFSPEIFVSDWFKVIAFIVYIVCFIMVGRVLSITGLRR